MSPKQNRKTLSTRKQQLAARQAAITRAKREVLEKGSKHKRPLSLARRKVLALTASILAILIGAFIIVITLLIYVRHDTSALTYNVARVLPYPAAKVNGDYVSYAEYLFEVRYRKNIYENPTGPASATNQPIDLDDPANKEILADIERASMERAKLKLIVKQMAKEFDINVTEEELAISINELIERQGGEQKFISAIEEFYGWSMSDFQREFKSQLLEQKLQLAALPPLNSEQRKQAEDILAKAKAGEDFAKLAREHSQDPGSKDTGGDLGFVSANTPFVEEFKEAALKLEPGEVSDVVVTQFGFHILKATEKKGDEVKVSHILITFVKELDAVLSERLEEANIKNYIKLPEAPANGTLEENLDQS